jgi:hypothetical protein
MRAAPAAIKDVPSPTFHVSRSPRNTMAKSTEHHAQLIDRRDARSGTQLQCAVVAKPRESGWMPERIKNRTPFADKASGRCHSFRAHRMSAATIKMMMVRKNVARSELISDTATLPKIAVRAANNADSCA